MDVDNLPLLANTPKLNARVDVLWRDLARQGLRNEG